MKKIFILIGLIVSAVALTLTTSYAVPIQKNVIFQLTDYEMTPTSRTQIVTTNRIDLYDALHEIYSDVVSETIDGESIIYHDTNIKRNGVTHTLRIARTFKNSLNANQYHLRITFVNGQTLSLFVYDRDIVYESVFNGGWSKRVTKGQMVTNQVSTFENPNDFLGTYSVTGYIEQDINPGDGEIIKDFNTLPTTSGTLTDAKDASMVGYVYFDYNSANLFDTYIMLNGQQYNIGMIELPGVVELNKEPLSPGIYYTIGSTRYIYYEFLDNKSSVPLNEQSLAFMDDPNQVKGFRPFVELNLTTGDYVFTDKLGLYTAYYDGPNGEAYADVVFPMDIDDVLAIEIEYQYRWQYLWNFYTDWKTIRQARVKDEVVDVRTAWQSWSSLIFSFGPSGTGLYSEVASWFAQDTYGITRLSNLDNNYRNQYLKTINDAQTNRGNSTLTMDQVFMPDSSVYRIFLNTYNDGRYTGYEIHDDIAIIYVTYQYKGEIYHVDYDDIDNVTGGGASDPFKDFENFMKMFNQFMNYIDKIDWNNAFVIGIAIVAVIIFLIILGPMVSLITLLFKAIRLGFKSILMLIKFIFKIPGQFIAFLKFLFVPGKTKKSKYRRRYYT